MGAYKNILIDIQSNVCEIGAMLIQSEANADIDEMKSALRSAITNSALALAFIAELEN
jgi:hypothetical protein